MKKLETFLFLILLFGLVSFAGASNSYIDVDDLTLSGDGTYIVVDFTTGASLWDDGRTTGYFLASTSTPITIPGSGTNSVGNTGKSLHKDENGNSYYPWSMYSNSAGRGCSDNLTDIADYDTETSYTRNISTILLDTGYTTSTANYIANYGTTVYLQGVNSGSGCNFDNKTTEVNDTEAYTIATTSTDPYVLTYFPIQGSTVYWNTNYTSIVWDFDEDIPYNGFINYTYSTSSDASNPFMSNSDFVYSSAGAGAFVFDTDPYQEGITSGTTLYEKAYLYKNTETSSELVASSSIVSFTVSSLTGAIPPPPTALLFQLDDCPNASIFSSSSLAVITCNALNGLKKVGNTINTSISNVISYIGSILQDTFPINILTHINTAFNTVRNNSTSTTSLVFPWNDTTITIVGSSTMDEGYASVGFDARTFFDYLMYFFTFVLVVLMVIALIAMVHNT